MACIVRCQQFEPILENFIFNILKNFAKDKDFSLSMKDRCRTFDRDSRRNNISHYRPIVPSLWLVLSLVEHVIWQLTFVHLLGMQNPIDEDQNRAYPRSNKSKTIQSDFIVIFLQEDYCLEDLSKCQLVPQQSYQKKN